LEIAQAQRDFHFSHRPSNNKSLPLSNLKEE